MSSALLTQFIAFPASLLLGGWLALICYSNPAQAKTSDANVLIAQAVVEPLPPPPPIPSGSNTQQSLPPLQPDEQLPVIEFQQPPPYQAEPVYQNNRNYNRNYNRQGRYLVYVDSNDYQLLQRVRRVEPGAFLRRFQGRSVIQAGLFSRRANAQQRVRQLQNYGIGGARFANSSDRQDLSYLPDGNNYERRSNYYYVAIPGRSEDLSFIEDRIRRNAGQNTPVIPRNHPRGAHVAVGPFAQRSDAEQWNRYLQSIGFGNARVYYGR